MPPRIMLSRHRCPPPGRSSLPIVGVILTILMLWPLEDCLAFKNETTIDNQATLEAALQGDPGQPAPLEVEIGATHVAMAAALRLPQGRTVILSGAPPIPISFDIGREPPTAGDLLEIHLFGAAPVKEGDFIKVDRRLSGPMDPLVGCWPVVAVKGDTVVLRRAERTSNGAPFEPGRRAAKILSTVLTFKQSIGVMAGTSSEIRNLVVEGNRSHGSIGVLSGSQELATPPAVTAISLGPDVCVTGFADGGVYAQFGASARLSPDTIVSENGLYGLHAQTAGSINANGVTVLANGSHNVIAQYGGAIYFQGGASSEAGGCGVLAQLGGSVLAKKSTSDGNAAGGFCGWYNGSLQAGGATASNNAGAGVFAKFRGLVYFDDGLALRNEGGILAESGGSVAATRATLTENRGPAVSVSAMASVDITAAQLHGGVASLDATGRVFGSDGLARHHASP